MTGTAFDRLAPRYDMMWSDSAIGRHQRHAVWRRVDPLFEPGSRVLDLGCGTGVDAAHWKECGLEVVGIDASAEMVRVARERGVRAYCLDLESLGALDGRFDGAISNFGALNCVANLAPVSRVLGRLVRPGGYLAVCLMGPCCAWEVAHYLRCWQPRKAFRRWSPAGARTSMGMRVHYPSLRRLVRAFNAEFRLIHWCGIGLCVPPSYADGLAESTLARLAGLDRKLAHVPILRSLSDHRLLIFERL